MTKERKKKALFICTGNSCRSQMAEGFLRVLGVDKWEAYSAGLDPQGVNPNAVKVMSEVGVDISGQRSKPIDPAILQTVDLVITLCGSADERCPTVPAYIRREHWAIEDPALATGTPDEILDTFRRVRDEIRRRIERLAGRD
ncbi:MAG: arsenate reductase (thioredoxin) [Betaproteobacteria bacterium]